MAGTHESAHPSSRARGAFIIATALLSATGAALVTWPLARELGSATLRTGEVLLTAWQLNWYQQALLTDPRAWIDANIFFPYDHASTFNDLLLTHAVVTLPAWWAESPVLALNLALLGGIMLCGVFTHLLIVELVDDPLAGTVGGVLFALAPFRFLHLGHLSIAAAWAVPLFFWALLRHLRRPSRGRAALATVSGVAVALSSLYHAAYVAPIVPLVLLFGSRRGPGGRRTWLPLVATGLPCLAFLAWMLAPFATTLRTFGLGAAPHDLLRYGADLSSLAQKPDFLGGSTAPSGINPEAHLYPGAALAVLAIAGAIIAIGSLLALRGWPRRVAVTALACSVVLAAGLLLPLQGAVGRAWNLGILALIWLGPLAAAIWAIAGTTARSATGPVTAVRLGVAGAALSYVLALGPEARYLAEPIGSAPYSLLTLASSAFEGTRVPARFGGIVILFLALVAAGAIATLARGTTVTRRAAGIGVAVLALITCFGELPVPALPTGNTLVPLPDLRDPAYDWLGQRPGHFGVLELPDWPSGGGDDYEYRGWRALRYMLASKQHGQRLANGTGRIEPFLWNRFNTLAPWSDDFFAFITAYFPVDYVLVHEGGIPDSSRGAVWGRLESGTDGWRETFRSEDVRVYTIDRSAGRGTYLDRLLLRHDVAPRAVITFAARLASGAPAVDEISQPSPTLELLRDGAPVGAWELHHEWQRFDVTIPVAVDAPRERDGWPRSGALFRWRMRGDSGPAFELRDLLVARAPEPGS